VLWAEFSVASGQSLWSMKGPMTGHTFMRHMTAHVLINNTWGVRLSSIAVTLDVHAASNVWLSMVIVDSPLAIGCICEGDPGCIASMDSSLLIVPA